MKWKLTAFRFSLNRLPVSAILSIRSASVFRCSLALSWLCYFAPVANAQQPNSDSVTLSQILSILEAWNAAGYAQTFPVTFPNGMALSEYLMYASGWEPSYTPGEDLKSILLRIAQNQPSNVWTRSDISRLATNVWTRSDIDRLVSYSNIWTRADIDRLLSNSNAWSSSSVSSLFDYIGSIDSYASSLDYSLGDVDSLLNSLYQMYSNTFDLNKFRHPSFRVEDEILKDIYQARAQDASPADSAIRVVDPYTHDVIETLLTELAKLTESITNQVNSADSSTNLVAISGALTALLEGVEDVIDQMDLYFPQYSEYWYQLLYYNLGYHLRDGDTIASDLLDLRRQLGVESPSRTNNIFHTLQRFFDDSESRQLVSSTGSIINAEIRSAETTAQSVISSSSNEVARIAEDEEPDWDEHRFTGPNPFDSGDNIFDLPQRQANSVFLSLPDSQHKEIVLFRGNLPIYGGPQSTRSQSSVSLDISYPLVDYDAVSGGIGTMRDIMEWVWTWVSLLINVLLLFRFYQSLARSAIGSEQGFFNE